MFAVARERLWDAGNNATSLLNWNLASGGDSLRLGGAQEWRTPTRRCARLRTNTRATEARNASRIIPRSAWHTKKQTELYQR